MGVEHEVADRFHSIAIHLLRRVRRADEGSGVSPAELSALSVIVFGGPISLGDLAAAEQVRPPSMTRIVRLLEERGLVVRDADAEDRRVVRIRASANGERVIRQGRSARVKLLSDLLEQLSPHELNDLKEAGTMLERVLGVPRREPAK